VVREHRRLAAIVLADVVGYSRLMGRDDSGTLAALKRYRREIIDPKVAEYAGRLVKTMGDGLLLEFASVVDAVRCFVEVQRAMAAHNAGVPAEMRIDFRVGINVGDIIIDGEDIFGDGVNIAARLQALAEPGGICISGKVHEEVSHRSDCSFTDRGLQRVKNIAQPVRAYTLSVVGRGTTVADAGMPGPVSAARSMLYGRANDLPALCGLIEHHGVVTIVGAGGIGKTRLAEAALHELGEVFPDRVLVELAPLADPALVPVSVARALGLTVSDASVALDMTVQALAGKRLLLVLDNCEHVLEAVDRLVTALRKGAEQVHILATSQELLRQPDEHVYRLGTLTVPAETSVSSAQGAGAVELFVARVQAVEPRFVLSDDNVRAVIEICRRLDGIPLAIELAAARVPLLGVEGVRERLDERFRLLTAGSRLALRRHQTLHAALEWSYGLLSEREQAVFEQLGVFAGSFSLECSQSLAADGQMDEWSVLDHLGALLDKSLVTVDVTTGTRYRMLETARAFALERLAARGATAQAMRRHAEVMLDRFESFYRDLLGGAPLLARVAKLAPDLDNLRGALRWASEAGGDRRIGIALLGAAGAARGYFGSLHLQAEGWHWCQVFKPLFDASIPAAGAARFWLTCAEHGTAASVDVSMQDAQRALALYRDTEDRVGTYLACLALLYALTLAGRYDEAVRVFEEASKLCDVAWPPRLRMRLENHGGLLFDEVGLPGKAREHLVEHLRLAREAEGEGESEELTALVLLVDLDVALGQIEQAASRATGLLKQYHAWPSGADSGLTLRNIATAMTASNRLDEAQTLYREALLITRRNYGSGAFVLDDATMLLARCGRIDDAARVFAYAERVYADLGRRPRLVARQNRERLLALLAAERSPEALARLYEEGRRLTDDQACALAFPS
jgi:predicted ATPase/class 3 adenylate cyclase